MMKEFQHKTERGIKWQIGFNYGPLLLSSFKAGAPKGNLTIYIISIFHNIWNKAAKYGAVVK